MTEQTWGRWMKEKQAHVSGHKAEEQCYNKSQ